MNIRLTSEGLSLMLAEGVVFFAAFSTGANLVYVVGSMILSLFIISLALGVRGFKGLAAITLLNLASETKSR